MPPPDKPSTLRQAAEQVAARLRGAGHIALFAGGCVRDLLMGREPADYDVATDAVPAKVCGLFRRTLTVGAQFGVVIVLLGEFQVEVATFRSESGYADGRHPDEVRFSDARQDAARRDFTINGMFLDPATNEVIDYVGGQADLAAGLVRAIGEPAERFAEDHLRMLRAVRFACVLDFAVEPRTADAIVACAPAITGVSAERVWQEWSRLLGHPNRQAGWKLAQRTGLVTALWPDLAAHGDRIAARLGQLDPAADDTAALACQLADQSASRVEAACRDLSLDNRRRLDVLWLVGHAGDLLTQRLDRVALKKLLAEANWPRLVMLSRAMALECGGLPPRDVPLPPPTGGVQRPAGADNLAANLSSAAAIPPDRIAPPPLIDGQDVMALGVPEGRRVGLILAAVYDAQLAEQIASRAQALDVAARLARQAP